MNHCPETAKLLEAGLDPSTHCDACKAVSEALLQREADLDRALDAFARAGDPEKLVAVALSEAALLPRTPEPARWDRRFHGGLILLAVGAVLLWLWSAGGAPPPPAPEPEAPVAPVEEPLVEQTQAAEAVAAIPWNALTAQQWREKADELRELATAIEKDRDLADPKVQAVLFDLWAQIGRAAENANDPSPPYYGKVGETTMNLGWYYAASLAHKDADLMARLDSSPDVKASVAYYKTKIADGKVPGHYGNP